MARHLAGTGNYPPKRDRSTFDECRSKESGLPGAHGGENQLPSWHGSGVLIRLSWSVPSGMGVLICQVVLPGRAARSCCKKSSLAGWAARCCRPRLWFLRFPWPAHFQIRRHHQLPQQILPHLAQLSFQSAVAQLVRLRGEEPSDFLILKTAVKSVGERQGAVSMAL